MLYCPFRKTGQGVLVNGEVKILKIEAVGKPIVRSFQRGTRCARLESLVQIPEAGRSMPEQVEAFRKEGGGPNQC